MNLNWNSNNALPNTAERAKILAHHIENVPSWVSLTSLSRPGEKLKYPDLLACAALAGHIRSRVPLDPSTPSGFSNTRSFKGLLFGTPLFQYDNAFGRNEVLAWGLLRKTELSSHGKIMPAFSKHGLPSEEIVDLYSIDNFQIFDRVTKVNRILSEREFISRLKLEFMSIREDKTPDDGFIIISDPTVFKGRHSAIDNFLKELNEEEHPFVVADRHMPHNLRLSNISSHFKDQFPRKERLDFFVPVIRDALQDFPWNKYPLFANLQEVRDIPIILEKSNTDFLRWYAQELIPAVLGTYLKQLHNFATHGWVTPQNITIVGIPTDLDSVEGPEITESPIDESKKVQDYRDAGSSVYDLCTSFKILDTSLAYKNLQRAYTIQSDTQQ